MLAAVCTLGGRRADPLSDVLQSLKISGALLFRAELSAPWCYAIPDSRVQVPAVLRGAARVVRFHVVLDGWCVATIRNAVHRLGPGEVILLPHGEAHHLGSAPGLPGAPMTCPPFELGRCDEQLGLVKPAAAAATTLLCGFLGCDEPAFELLVRMLPAAIIERTGSVQSRWFEVACEHMARPEASPRDPGWHGTQQRLVELIFIEIMRRHLAALPADRRGWLAAMHDPAIGRALAELHTDPGRAWTTTALAKRVGLSRSTLAERFRSTTGATPMHYLTTWRVQLAADLLRTTEVSIAEAAARIGYRSEAAFFRAFRRTLGESPACWRARWRRSSVTTGP